MRPFRYSNIILVLLLIVLDMAYLAGIVEWWWLLIVFMVYVLLLFLGAINIQWNFYLRSFNSGNKSKQIAITFDDGPGKETVAILDILKHQQVPAAFFTIGNRAAAQPIGRRVTSRVADATDVTDLIGVNYSRCR